MLEPPPVLGAPLEPAAAIVLAEPPLPAAACVPALALPGAPPVPAAALLGVLWLPAAAVAAPVPALFAPDAVGGGVLPVGVVELLPPDVGFSTGEVEPEAPL